MFQTYMEQYKTNYTEIEPGKISSYFSVIPHMYQDVIYRFLSRVLPYTVSIIAVIGYFYYVDWRVGATFTGMMCLLGIILSLTLRTCVERNVEKHRIFYDNNENITDRMSNLFSILVNNRDHAEIKSNREREEIFRKRAFQADIGYLKVETIINVVLFITVIIVLILYLHLFRVRRKSSLVLASFLVVFHLIGYVDRVKWHFIDLVNKVGIIQHFEETSFTHTVSDEATVGTRRDFIHRGDIKLQNIGFSYGNKVIHENLNLAFTPNHIHIIKGHSGRGKTTIIKLLLGFHSIDKGRITIDGVDLKEADIGYVRDQFSVVNQDARLFNEPILYNILYGNEKTATPEDVFALVKQLGINKTVFDNLSPKLDKRAGTNGAHLSNGQRQTILLMRAFLNKRKILIFDEPTASLDAKTKATVLKIIEGMCKTHTTIIITHDDLKMKATVHKI